MNRLSSTIISAGFILTMLATVGDAQPLTIIQPQLLMLSPPSQNPENEEQLQVFMGTVISMASGMLVLKDDAKDIFYGLDNQAVARKFADKKVAVTGTLDKMHTIHIKNIEEQKV
jgi:hypothetical protein